MMSELVNELCEWLPNFHKIVGHALVHDLTTGAFDLVFTPHAYRLQNKFQRHYVTLQNFKLKM